MFKDLADHRFKIGDHFLKKTNSNDHFIAYDQTRKCNNLAAWCCQHQCFTSPLNEQLMSCSVNYIKINAFFWNHFNKFEFKALQLISQSKWNETQLTYVKVIFPIFYEILRLRTLTRIIGITDKQKNNDKYNIKFYIFFIPNAQNRIRSQFETFICSLNYFYQYERIRRNALLRYAYIYAHNRQMDKSLPKWTITDAYLLSCTRAWIRDLPALLLNFTSQFIWTNDTYSFSYCSIYGN